MTAYLSDRRRVELAMPAAMMWRVAYQIFLPERYRDDEPVVHRLWTHDVRWQRVVLKAFNDAAYEAVEGMTADDKAKLVNRIIRTRAQVLGPFEQQCIATVIWAVISMVNELIESGVLVAHARSPFARALCILSRKLESLPENVATLDNTERSGRKNGRRLLERLRQRGLYREFDQCRAA